MLETNILNYYNTSTKEQVEVIGYIYDNTEPINFKYNTKVQENVKFYCLKLFAIKIKSKDWKLVSGFIKVAINKVPLGSFVRLKGVLSKNERNVETRCLNLVKFKKENKDWVIEPIKPQEVRQDRLNIDVLYEYKKFIALPMLYKTDFKIDYSSLPVDKPMRTQAVETKYLENAIFNNKKVETKLGTLDKNVYISSLTFRLMEDIFKLKRAVVNINDMDSHLKPSFIHIYDLYVTLNKYSRKPSKTENFITIQNSIVLEDVPYIRFKRGGLI